MHQFKRVYLLTAIALSIGIPFITFNVYVEPKSLLGTFQSPMIDAISYPEVIEEAKVEYTTTILWSIYSLGAILFFVKFCINLSQLFIRIQRNPKYKSKYFVKVLLNDLAIPHTFFNYIFLNKVKFESNQIPKEVLLHEETHALQKHSIDILIIELLQVVFWFNPLIYIAKHSIKLNHEFLADEAVLLNGIQPSQYQQLLLAFSSNVTEPKLANAINYSSIKKRFTVMKTHTSKQKIWLRSALFLPIIALTLYSFSERKIIEKQPINPTISELSKLNNIPILEITFAPDTFKLNGKSTSLSQLKVDFITATNNKKSDLDIKVTGGINMSLINKIMSELKGNLIKINLDENAYIIGDDVVYDTQQKATPEEIVEYNKLAQYYSSQPEKKRMIKQKDIERMQYIHDKMNDEQKANAEPFPNIVPPPPPPIPMAPSINKTEDAPPLPPPPAPIPPLDHVIRMAKKGAAFYYEGKSISSDEAIKLLKKNNELNISTKQSDSKQPKVYISKEPIVIKN
jgi:hypothetical protein